MKTELQKQFEKQTPTIKGITGTEYLQTFISWLHLQVEKRDAQLERQVKMSEIIKVLEGNLETIKDVKKFIKTTHPPIVPLTEGKTKTNIKQYPNGVPQKKGPPPPSITAPYLSEERIECLAEIYNKSVHDAAIVANVCDSVLDRTGGLLGEVRKAARNKLNNE